jgi:hypothetical protein
MQVDVFGAIGFSAFCPAGHGQHIGSFWRQDPDRH